jgi:oligoendopeptidase F
MADAATLADHFSIDIRDEAFWTASLDIIREDINTYEKLVSQFA